MCTTDLAQVHLRKEMLDTVGLDISWSLICQNEACVGFRLCQWSSVFVWCFFCKR